MAPMQKRALIGLGIGIVMTIAIVTILVTKGVTTSFDDKATRIFINIFYIGGLILYYVTVSKPMSRSGNKNTLRDERDEQILKSATNTQLMAIIISLVAWAIALTEVYWDEGAIPIVFPYLIFISIIIINIVAQAAGILIGYWRAR